jgi:hypothetical protein
MDGASRLLVWVDAKEPAKSTVGVELSKLADTDERGSASGSGATRWRP